MKLRLSLAVLLIMAVRVICQQPASAPALPKDPRALIEAARVHYDFTDPKLKPWHLKASYQLYDLNGKLAEQGSWEYWWVSARIRRSTEQRAGASQTMWAAADGVVYRRADGTPLKYFERNIDSVLLNELPRRKLLDASKSHLAYKIYGKGPSSTPCITVMSEEPMSNPAYYCFDPATFALLETLTDNVENRFFNFEKMGDHYIPRNIEVRIGNQTALAISILQIGLIEPKDPALIPGPNAIPVPRSAIDVFEETTLGEHAQQPAKKTFPLYPQLAESGHMQGVVVLGATIAVDGKISDLEVLGTPSPILSKSAIDYVKASRYKPFIVDGKVVEVEVMVHVIYTMSG